MRRFAVGCSFESHALYPVPSCLGCLAVFSREMAKTFKGKMQRKDPNFALWSVLKEDVSTRGITSDKGKDTMGMQWNY